jgi:hypothetical protein
VTGNGRAPVNRTYFDRFGAPTLTPSALALSKTATVSAPPKSSQNRAKAKDFDSATSKWNPAYHAWRKLARRISRNGAIFHREDTKSAKLREANIFSSHNFAIFASSR